MNVLTDPVDADETAVADLVRRYGERVADEATSLGRERIAEASDLDAQAIEAAIAGDPEEVTVETAATVLAIADGVDPTAGIAAVRDHLLLAMSGAMIDVEALARAVAGDMDPGEVQAKVEGRRPMTLDEYAHLQHTIARRGP